MVDIREAAAEYREAAVRGQESPAREYFFDCSVPNRSSVQKRLSICNWNPRPRRGKEGAIEKQIAGKWHIITLQEAIEYVDHKPLTNKFHVTHCGGCAVLFNKDTFFPNVNVKSIYLHDTRRETKAGFYRACYHVPLFVDNLSAAKKHSRSCRYTFVTYTLRNVVFGKEAHSYNSCSDP